ncbi:unnamed protein product [Adineta steineri]|uniref:Uncharacterized protein n=1 Tax=Adineta steineri TaxID=433720 RepID=A0A814SKT1_9BILA|nr:unnamed protein product [Adineta steineri]
MKLNEEIQKNALLHNAIMKDYEHIFLLLLKSGFSPNTLLSDHKTPLSIAVVSNNLSPTKQSNYSIMYTYFRDYLLSNYCDQGQVELNAGLQNALFNWCLPIATDLLEYGAIIDALKRIDSLENFFSQIADLTAFENQLRNVEEERDRFRRELNKHKRSSKDMDEPQLAKVIREKEDLQLLLNKFERHMGEIQGNIKVLTNERDNISVLYEQAKEELQRARHDILQSVQTPKVSLAAQSILRKVESERDAALIEARTSANERDTIRERLRVATDTSLTERARLEQRIEDLQIEIRKLDNDREDILQQNHLLREQIKDYESKVDEQLFTISQLNQELNDQKTTSSQLRFLSEEAERLVQENQRQLNLKKEELRVQEEKTHRLEKKLYDTQEMNKGIKDDFHVVRSTVHTLDKEKDRLCGELDLKAEENLHLIQELNSKTRRIEELSMMIAELEAALDRTKDDTKQKLKEITSMRMQLDRNLEELNEYRRKLDLGVRDNKRLQDDLLTVTRENQDLTAFENQLRNVEEERDRFRRELNKHKRSSKDMDEPQLAKVIREKEDLQLLLNKFERHMGEIQGNIKVLTNERDNISVLYEQAKEELQRARHDILQSVQTPKVSLAAQSILRKVESERDAALIEARTSANERDTIRERLRVATDTSLTERARLEQRIEDLQIEIRKLDNDREDILQQNHLLREQIKDYESKVDEQLFTISQLNQELNDQKTTSSQLRFLSEEAERLVQENQRQLNLKKEELRVQEEKTHRLEKKLYDTQEMNKGIKDDFHVVRSTVHTLDKEKDRLCGELDLKAEENLHLIQELNSKTRRIEELSMMIAELEAALDRTKDDTKQKLKEITSMRMQLDRNLEELNEYRRKLDLGVRDNKRLQDDLLTVTRENQTLHQELEHAIDDKENLKLQVQEYIKEVSKCENVISQKENDRTTLFEQYREATNELSRAKLTLADIESQAANLRQELHIKSADMKRLAERTDYLERELQQHISVNHEYEIQLSNMNRSIQRNEEIIKRLQIEKQNYATEISNVRDLNSTVENKKEHIIRELTGREIENEQLQAAISDMKLEIDMLHTQINNEKAMVRSLEEIIGSSREKEFQSQVQAQEKDSDLQLAKERANMTDVKIQSQGKEIAALRAQVIGLESDNDRLKRQLTSERFEREKAAQDLRKLTDLTSNIEYDSRYRSTSPRVTPSVSATNNYRSSTRNYSPSRSEHPQTSPTKGIDRSCSLCVDTTP